MEKLGVNEHEDRCLGALLGCACGDILGANFEFKTRAEIRKSRGEVRDFIGSLRRPLGRYTDDTEMTLALATSLVERQCLDPGDVAVTYARLFSYPPLRGYGPSVTKVLRMIADGADYRTTGTAVHADGSHANGGAMRIAPIGLAFRNSDHLREAVRLALLPTHTHPEAVDAATIQASLVSVLSQCRDLHFHGMPVIPTRIAECAIDRANTQAMLDKIELVERSIIESWSVVKMLDSICTPNPFGRHFQIRAIDAMACVLWICENYWEDPEQCLIEAIGLGGDTDTIGAMIGALMGALYGTSWIPKRWFDNIENDGQYGRDGIIEVARKLARLDLKEVESEAANTNQ